MAETLTRAELEELITKLEQARNSMTHENHRVCGVCFALYTDGKGQCWCDYVSDWYYRED